VPTDSDDPCVTDHPLPPYYRASKKGGAATVLGAAMVAVGEILEPERSKVEIVQMADDTLDDDPLKLDFSGLPDIDA
jgi:hypothetical protein